MEIPVKYSVDILVAGGGPTGVAAAVCVEDGVCAKDADVSKIQNIIGVKTR